jgi:hypothetical protein
MENQNSKEENINYVFLDENGERFSVKHLVKFLGKKEHGGYSGFINELRDATKYLASYGYPRENEGAESEYSNTIFQLFNLMDALQQGEDKIFNS